MGLRRVCPDVRFLGSYPRADARPDADSDRVTDDAIYRDAAAWLGRVRDGRSCRSSQNWIRVPAIRWPST